MGPSGPSHSGDWGYRDFGADWNIIKLFLHNSTGVGRSTGEAGYGYPVPFVQVFRLGCYIQHNKPLGNGKYGIQVTL